MANITFSTLITSISSRIADRRQTVNFSASHSHPHAARRESHFYEHNHHCTPEPHRRSSAYAKIDRELWFAEAINDEEAILAERQSPRDSVTGSRPSTNKSSIALPPYLRIGAPP